MDEAIARRVDGLTNSGLVNAAGNRRALRVGSEPLDVFRRYMAMFCREQAYCHFSPALVRNLEQHWNAHQRSAEQSMPSGERVPREELQALQLKRLRATFEWSSRRSRTSPQLPFTDKSQLREAYPFGPLRPKLVPRTAARIERHTREADRVGYTPPTSRRGRS